MKIIYYQYIIILFITFFITNINAEKALVNIKTKFPISSIRINQNETKIINYHNNFNNIKFLIESEAGDKITLNISSEFYTNKSLDDDICLLFKFKGGISYYFNKKNISIINNQKSPNKNNNLLLQVIIPYEILCKSHEDIILKKSNSNITFYLNSSVILQKNETYLRENLKIQIVDMYYSYKNSTPIYPIMNFNKSQNYQLNTTFKINFKNELRSNNSLIIKYKGINSENNIQSNDVCSLEIKSNEKRYLQAVIKQDEYYYTFGEIFENENAQDDIDNIVEFLNHDINVFNISIDFFQDLCYHYERNHHDYVLEDRIEFFYQNYSLCDSNCNLTQIYYENFSFGCICWPEVETEKTHHKKEHSMELNEDFSMEGLSQEMGNLFFESNLEVIKCFFVLLREKIILNNFGVIITGLLLVIQIMASLFLCSHMNDIRLYVFRDLIKCKYSPPIKRKATQVNKKENNDNNKNIQSKTNSLKKVDNKNTVNTKNGNYKENPQNLGNKNNFGIELSSVKNMIPVNSKINHIINYINDNNDYIYNNNINTYKYYKIPKKFTKRNNYNDNNHMKLNDLSASSQRKIYTKNKNYEILYSKNRLNNQKNYSINNIEKNLYMKNTEKTDGKYRHKESINISSENNNNNEYTNQYSDNNNSQNENNENIYSEKDVNINSEMEPEGYFNTQNDRKTNNTEKEEEQNKDLIYPYPKIDYDEDDLDGLDYDEALIYDKRTFCQLFIKQLKERQLIVNTCCVKDNLKPFSIKIIVLLFNISCYLVINGFLFNEEYVMKILRRTSKGFYYFIVDSTTRIVYSSIIGAIINIIVGLLFRADKQLRKIQSKYQDNKIILHGEIVKIYKSTKMLYIVFTIFNVLAMIVFIFYLFCFCGVYRNCQADWFEGCFIVIFLMQLLPVIVSLLLAIFRKAGIVCKVEFLFKINSWIIENI